MSAHDITNSTVYMNTDEWSDTHSETSHCDWNATQPINLVRQNQLLYNDKEKHEWQTPLRFKTSHPWCNRKQITE